ncbi:LOW QUALITY PROTEIN: beta,beta-carotene 15,15'-dioxygenase-like [Pecten maximus]|uniref:LOW QUALITY PROTEIN: beta,beta-carotene 15,15'-dioxygenase-like n=1 Tax=Pecten maximus TaxID=6579 RepID=UPI0014581B50|nr:LOW QUALITY PROTEIN: beta,beta-carotene 15,15'-dioxygenase-like [Pecten maximus]
MKPASLLCSRKLERLLFAARLSVRPLRTSTSTGNMHRLYEGVKDEVPATKGIVTGTIPPWVDGALYRNGPAIFQIGVDKFEHLFDGMGAIQKYEVKDGMAVFSRKFINSNSYQKNMAANRIVVSEFGTIAQYPDPCKNIFQRFFSYFKLGTPTDNTSITVWPLRDRIFTSTETHFLHEIDPDNLDTISKVDLKQYLTINSAVAHVHWDREGTIHSIGHLYEGHPSYCIFRIPGGSDFKDSKVVASVKSRWKMNPGYYHSFAVTENYYVFLEQPLVANVFKILTSRIRGKRLPDCLDYWPNEKVIFHIIDKATGEQVNKSFVYQSDAFFTFHHVNAYEDGGSLVLDMCTYTDAQVINKVYMKDFNEENIDDTLRDLPMAMLSRFVLPLNVTEQTPCNKNLIEMSGCDATAVKTTDTTVDCTPDTIYDKGFELPTVNYDLYNGRKYRYSYGFSIQSGKVIALVKVDIVNKTSLQWDSPGCMPTEPIFVADPNGTEEDDGVVLSAVCTTSEDQDPFLLVLDGKTFTEVARARFPGVQINRDLHGFFRKAVDCRM